MLLIPTDVPPLEDLSDAVRRARALQTQVPGNPLSRTSDDESRMRSRNGGAAKKGIAVDQSKSERLGKSPTKLGEAEERRGASSRVFGGFAKGFLLSESSNSGEDIGKSKPAPKSQSSTEKQVKKKSVSSLADADSKGLSVKTGSAQSSVSTDDNVPFLRMNKTESKGPVFPEVQEAMKEAYPLLNTQGHTHTHTPCMYSHLLMSFNSHSSPSPISLSLSSLPLLSPSPLSLSSLPLLSPLSLSLSPEWLTESLLEKMEKHPVLSKALHDPQLAQVMSQFQSNPKAVLQAAAGNPDVQEFLKEFCALMGDHFSDLADKEEGKQSPKGKQEALHQKCCSTTSFIPRPPDFGCPDYRGPPAFNYLLIRGAPCIQLSPD